MAKAFVSNCGSAFNCCSDRHYTMKIKGANNHGGK